MRYFRRLLTSIRNLIVWFPVIWRDKQWDHYYLEVIILRKIRLMRAYHEKSDLFVGVEEKIKWMKIFERLLVILTENKYWDDEYDHAPLNLRNADLNEHTRSVATPFNGYYPEIRTNKARRLLYKIIAWRSPYWWD